MHDSPDTTIRNAARLLTAGALSWADFVAMLPEQAQVALRSALADASMVRLQKRDESYCQCGHTAAEHYWSERPTGEGALLCQIDCPCSGYSTRVDEAHSSGYLTRVAVGPTASSFIRDVMAAGLGFAAAAMIGRQVSVMLPPGIMNGTVPLAAPEPGARTLTPEQIERRRHKREKARERKRQK